VNIQKSTGFISSPPVIKLAQALAPAFQIDQQFSHSEIRLDFEVDDKIENRVRLSDININQPEYHLGIIMDDEKKQAAGISFTKKSRSDGQHPLISIH
jgi:hypothetical protein